jgi:hypothetical protein
MASVADKPHIRKLAKFFRSVPGRVFRSQRGTGIRGLTESRKGLLAPGWRRDRSLGIYRIWDDSIGFAMGCPQVPVFSQPSSEVFDLCVDPQVLDLLFDGLPRGGGRVILHF